MKKTIVKLVVACVAYYGILQLYFSNNCSGIKRGGEFEMMYNITTFVSKAGIKGRDKKLHPTDTVGCNYLSLLLIPVPRTEVLVSDDIWNLS